MSAEPKVVPLSPAWKTPEANREELLGLVRELLTKAEAGEVESIAVAAVTPGGVTHCTWKRGANPYATIAGAVAALQHEIQTDWAT